MKLLVNGTHVQTQAVPVAPRATEKVVFSLPTDTGGLHEVDVGGLKGVLKVWHAGQTPGEIHRESWLNTVSKAEGDRYYSYAIYASRTLAVSHPEVYLQADDIFVRVITTNPGFRQAYKTKDVHSGYFYELRPRGDSFSFNDVGFDQYKLVSLQETYPPGYPLLPFFDRRLAPIAASLKTFDNRVSQLEKAEQLYFKAKRDGARDLFLIYCDNENAYLYQSGSLLQVQDGRKVTSLGGNPILIFNEQHVWYPLMLRDDTGKSQLLKELVAQYSTARKQPELSDFESGLLDRLRSVTEVETPQRLAYLKVVSSLYQQRMPDMLPPDRAAELRQLGIPLTPPSRAWTERRNVISPVSAYLAAIARLQTGRKGIEALCSEYLRHTATPGRREAHGHIWFGSMFWGSVDDSYRTRAGICVEQAANIGAALELAGIDSYSMEGLADLGNMHYAHDFLYIPAYDLVVSNETIRKSSDADTVLDWNSDKAEFAYRYLDFIEHDGKWATICPEYSGTLSPQDTLEIMTRLRAMHGDDIQGGVRPQASSKMWEGRLNAIPFEQLKQYLLTKQRGWQPYRLP